MKIKKVTHHVLTDYQGSKLNDMTGEPEELRDKNPDLFNNMVAFCSLLSHPDGNLYCGLTRFNGDFFYRFDPNTKRFESLNYRKVHEFFECKIHRSLTLDRDGTIYGATSCLHPVNRRLDAPGGAIFEYHPDSGILKKIANPVKHDYIQTITLDPQRRLIYGQTYPVFKFFVYNLQTKETRDFDYTGSISHISCLDDDGGYWSTWSNTRHWLYRFDPDKGAVQWFKFGLPNSSADSNIMYPGAGPIDSMVNGGDGWLYVGTCGGSLCRIQPGSAKVEYLGHPAPTRRMPGLKNFRDNFLMGCCGDEEGGCLFLYDKASHQFHVLGPIVDTISGMPLYRTHDLEIGGNGNVFVAETDVPDRSGYLWEIELD